MPTPEVISDLLRRMETGEEGDGFARLATAVKGGIETQDILGMGDCKFTLDCPLVDIAVLDIKFRRGNDNNLYDFRIAGAEVTIQILVEVDMRAKFSATMVDEDEIIPVGDISAHRNWQIELGLLMTIVDGPTIIPINFVLPSEELVRIDKIVSFGAVELDPESV